jgi:hypothetical protein
MNSFCSSFHTLTTIYERKKRCMGPHKNGAWALAKKTYWTTKKWHMTACKKDIWDYTNITHEGLWKIHMGLHKNGTWALVKKAYGTTQNWHMNACEKHICDYTNMAHECLWKMHMGLHKISTWLFMKKTYGTTQSWHMNNCFLLFLGNFGNNVQHFVMWIFYFLTRREMWLLEANK